MGVVELGVEVEWIGSDFLECLFWELLIDGTLIILFFILILFYLPKSCNITRKHSCSLSQSPKFKSLADVVFMEPL